VTIGETMDVLMEMGHDMVRMLHELGMESMTVFSDVADGEDYTNVCIYREDGEIAVSKSRFWDEGEA